MSLVSVLRRGICVAPRGLALLCAGLAGCGEQPRVQDTRAIPSPDLAWVATLEEVDNGLGFGLGALFEEVHIGKAGHSPSQHGNRGESVVFYVTAAEARHNAVQVQWLAPDRLKISYDASLVPGKRLAIYRGVSIEYAVRSVIVQ